MNRYLLCHSNHTAETLNLLTFMGLDRRFYLSLEFSFPSRATTIHFPSINTGR